MNKPLLTISILVVVATTTSFTMSGCGGGNSEDAARASILP